ncbi:BNR/Asp-box repeat protein [Rivularia sp. PCC 7116]|nr:BNR/Asp-box repeat protein [Rivularia sp. PCC 7116]
MRFCNLFNARQGKIFGIAFLAFLTAFSFQFFFNSDRVVRSLSHQATIAKSLYRHYPSLGNSNVAIGGGGYVTGIYIHPKQRNLVYIKTDIGGFYRWNAVNSSWIPLNEQLSLANSNYYGGEALALDPKDPNIIYIAVGKYTADWWQHQGTILKSLDKGRTWIKLNIDLKMGGNESQRWTGERLAVNPFNSQNLFFGSRQDGLWKSYNAGKTWVKVKSFPNLKDDIGINAIAFDKYNKGTIYALAHKHGVYKSTDTGNSWVKMADSPAQVNRIAIASKGSLYLTHAGGVSKFVKGNWQDITPLGNQIAFNAVTVNPNNQSDVIVATYTDAYTEIFRSVNGGSKWTQVKRQANNTVSWWSDYMNSKPSIASIEFDPWTKNRVWLTDWYGIWRTDNINRNRVVWTNYQKGHEEVVTFTLVSTPSGALISGLADVEGFYHDRGLLKYPSKMLSTKPHDFQDTYSIAYSQKNPLIMVRVGGSRHNNTYSGATSSDGGKTWKKFPSFPANQMATRVAMSASNPNLFVVTLSGNQPLRTVNAGVSWLPVTGLPNGFKGNWNWTQPLVADKVDGNLFYYYANGKVYRSDNGGKSFTAVSTSLPSSDWHSLKTGSGVKGELWLSLDKQGLYHSIDAGDRFTQISGVKRAYLIALGKPKIGSKGNAIYLYGEIIDKGKGIFRSLDNGKTWQRIGNKNKPIGNDPNVMEASSTEFGLVFIGTNGRGIYYGK